MKEWIMDKVETGIAYLMAMGVIFMIMVVLSAAESVVDLVIR